MKIYDDIPEALRQTSPRQPDSRSHRLPLIITGVGILAVVIGVGFILRLRSSSPNFEQASSVVPAASRGRPASSSTPDNLLGHWRYPEASPDQLQAIAPDGRLKLQSAAAQAYRAMAAAAAADGISLLPISGFRSIADQKYLFFEIKAERGQDTSQRAEVSAPPGYSEHHTGYAIDIGDADHPDTHLKTAFETTPAFQWLQANAAHYSFELSFPENNPQGVAYEPWHWRFVGNQESLESFYKHPNLKSGTPSAQP